MNLNSDNGVAQESPILLVPYMWIGDFVRCHSVIKLLKARYPQRPVDVLTSTLCAPLLDYMPGVRKGIVWDLPRRRLALKEHWSLATRLAAERHGSVLVMPRTWKSALAPFLAGIPERIGWVGVSAAARTAACPIETSQQLVRSISTACPEQICVVSKDACCATIHTTRGSAAGLIEHAAAGLAQA